MALMVSWISVAIILDPMWFGWFLFQYASGLLKRHLAVSMNLIFSLVSWEQMC